jgi:hypothetical protein
LAPRGLRRRALRSPRGKRDLSVLPRRELPVRGRPFHRAGEGLRRGQRELPHHLVRDGRLPRGLDSPQG